MIDYDAVADSYRKHRRVNEAVLDDLIDGAGIGVGSTVLEVGCGTGNYVAALAEKTGCRCTGIDPSERMLGYAGLSLPNVEFRQGAAEEIDFGGRIFDLVFSVDVIHHLSDRLAYFRRAGQVLSPGGFICTVTDSEDIICTREPLSRYFPETIAVELERYPAVGQVKQEMREAGFSEVWETRSEKPYVVTDLAPYREKAFSSLHLIPAAAHERGVSEMQGQLASGPIRGVARYCHIWEGKCAAAGTGGSRSDGAD